MSSESVTRSILERIDTLNATVHAYARVFSEEALLQARAFDAEIACGFWRGPLHGVPIGIKDLIYVGGFSTACGTLVMGDHDPGYDATVVSRLKRAGAVLLGKHQLSEGAGMQHHPAIDAPINPWSRDHWTGTSSSGSGVAVAMGLAYGSLGSDTGGSIRYPSAACGITAIKPSWGRVSRHGLYALSETFDHIGPMARTAEDCAHLLHAIAGRDPDDPTTVPHPVPDYGAALGRTIQGLKIGIDRRYTSTDVSSEVLAVFERALGTLEDLGARICDVHFPATDKVLSIGMNIVLGDMSLTHRETFPARAAEYGSVLRKDLESAKRLSGAEVAAGLLERAKFVGALEHQFADVELIATPAMPSPTPTVQQIEAYFDSPSDFNQTLGRFAIPFNCSGHPTMSLPIGFCNKGLPLGLQLAGRRLQEELLCRVGYAFQSRTDWHTRRPHIAVGEADQS